MQVANEHFIAPDSIVEQEAIDPNLCHWAEWYFLVHLSKLFVDNQQLSPNFYVDINGGREYVFSVQKSSISGMTHEDWETPRSVRLGAATRLILTGSLSDMVLVPSGKNYVIGRKLGPGFIDMDGKYSSLQQQRSSNGIRPDPYLDSQHSLLKSVQEKLVATNYLNLYTKLKYLLTNR